MKILILTDHDRYGGVAIASVSLQECLSASAISVERFPIHTVSRGIFGRMRALFKAAIYVCFSKADKIILMHFEAIIVGLLCRPFMPKSSLINVVHTDLYGYYSGSAYIKKVFLRCIFKISKNSAIIFVSKEAEFRAKKYFHLTNTRTIYNPITFPKTMFVSGIDRPFAFGCVSRLHGGKNIDLLIRVFDSFWEVNRNTKLLIFGEGLESVKLVEYAKSFPCFKAICFMGHVGDYEEIYSQIDTLVSFSSMEGFPLVVLEALSRNIPVLHSDCCCGPREILMPRSNPCDKTEGFEIAEGGMLVGMPKKIVPYRTILHHSENDLVEALSIFYKEFKKIKQASFVNLERFQFNTIRQQWMSLLLCAK
jgi:glycosyltransferase involved in cell wall biosynthesis